MAGVRMAVVMNIAVATIAVYIGAGGLGTIINEGITGTNSTKLIVGAVAVSLLAVVADYLFLFMQKLMTPKGLSEVTP
jgi:osmoprotectant transport system permease protein